MKFSFLFAPLVAGLGFFLLATEEPEAPRAQTRIASETPAKRLPEIPVSDGFDYPVGDGNSVTPDKDGDGWYNALDFRQRRHLGEDWNSESGGNTDCGEPVLAAAAGVVIFAANVGADWGQIVVVRHKLPDSRQVETLYAHLDQMHIAVGDVVRRGQHLADIGDAEPPCGDGQVYSAHLHFELRTPESRNWGRIGEGYALDATGWEDPSEFIDGHRKL